MGFTHSEKFPCKVSAKRMFKAMVVESHIHVPKIVPDGIKSIEYVKGERCVVGSINETKFFEGGYVKCIKARLEAIDVENFYCRYTVIEGGGTFKSIESVVDEVKFEPVGDGCVFMVTSEYHTKEGVHLEEEEVKKRMENALGVLKVVEEYLYAHPDVCA